MLLDEEKLVIKWLSQYHALKRAQVVGMLHEKTPDVAEKIIKNLIKTNMICELPGGYLALDHMDEIDSRTVTAIWVLLKFIDKIEPNAHYPSTYPSQIFFLKENIGYEIMVLYDGEQHLTRLLQIDDEDTKYIFVTPDVGYTQELVLPETPCLFATVTETEAVADVVFYQGGYTQT